MTSTDRELGRAVDAPSPARQPAGGVSPPSAPLAPIAAADAPTREGGGRNLPRERRLLQLAPQQSVAHAPTQPIPAGKEEATT